LAREKWQGKIASPQTAHRAKRNDTGEILENSLIPVVTPEKMRLG
jgi:hypothetical protein